MLPLWNNNKETANPMVSHRIWTAVMNGLVARTDGLVRSSRLQRGFSLVETIAAVAVVGIAVVGSVVLLATTVRTSDITQGDQGLVQLVRTQVETIQSAPYNDDANQYPRITNVPTDVLISFEATDPGIDYRVNGNDLGQVIQQIEVTARKDERIASMTFYKINTE